MSGIYVNPNTKFVGIGTTAPASRLQVDGNACFGSNVGTDAHTVIGSASVTCSNAAATSNAALTVNQQGTGKIFELQNSGTARITVLDGGNVGIGIANPTQKLYVVGDTRIEGNLTVNGTQTVINTDVITTEQLLVTNNGTGPALVVNQTGTQPIIDIQDDGVSVMKIINDGNIGMGTATPTQRLHVQGSILATTQHLGAIADTSNAPGFSWFGNTNTGIYRPATDAVGVVTGGVERMRVLANGNVGIGVTNPSKLLSVKGSMELGISSGDYQHLRIGGGNASGYIYGAFSKFGDGMHIGYNFYNDNVSNQISNSGGSTSRISCGYGKVEIHTGAINTEPSTIGLIVTNGNVGIGTTNPQAKLDVNGDINSSGYFLGKQNMCIFAKSNPAGSGATNESISTGDMTGWNVISLSSDLITKNADNKTFIFNRIGNYKVTWFGRVASQSSTTNYELSVYPTLTGGATELLPGNIGDVLCATAGDAYVMNRVMIINVTSASATMVIRLTPSSNLSSVCKFRYYGTAHYAWLLFEYKG